MPDLSRARFYARLELLFEVITSRKIPCDRDRDTARSPTLDSTMHSREYRNNNGLIINPPKCTKKYLTMEARAVINELSNSGDFGHDRL
jgi:hypothetical protein